MTGNIGIFQELVRGSANGSIDADLIKTADTHFGVDADKQLTFIPDEVVSNDDLSTATGTAVAPSQNAVRTLLSAMDNQGRFLPPDGATGEVLLSDGTYGPVPKRFTYTSLHHDNFDFNASHTTNSSPNHQSRVIGSGYDVNAFDMVQVYIGDPSNISNLIPNQVRQFKYETWLPSQIPLSTVIPSNSGFEAGRNRYMTGLQMQTWTFYELGNREGEPIIRLWSVSKESDGRLRVNYLRQSRSGFDENWYGFSGAIEMRVGITGINY